MRPENIHGYTFPNALTSFAVEERFKDHFFFGYLVALRIYTGKYQNMERPKTTLPGPMHNQPSHEMKCESMPIIFFITSVVKDLKNFTK